MNDNHSVAIQNNSILVDISIWLESAATNPDKDEFVHDFLRTTHE
jgi:hypothetical protein